MSISNVTYVGPFFNMPTEKVKMQVGVKTVCANGHTLTRSYEGKFCSHCGAPVSLEPAYQKAAIDLTYIAQGDDALNDDFIDAFMEIEVNGKCNVMLNEHSDGVMHLDPEDAICAYKFDPEMIASATETMRGHMDPIFKWCDLHGIARPEIHYGVVVFYM
jgi:hypothetical protein